MTGVFIGAGAAAGASADIEPGVVELGGLEAAFEAAGAAARGGGKPVSGIGGIFSAVCTLPEEGGVGGAAVGGAAVGGVAVGGAGTVGTGSADEAVVLGPDATSGFFASAGPGGAGTCARSGRSFAARFGESDLAGSDSDAGGCGTGGTSASGVDASCAAKD